MAGKRSKKDTDNTTVMMVVSILFDLIYISGGTKGITLEIKQESLIAFLHASLDDLCKG